VWAVISKLDTFELLRRLFALPILAALAGIAFSRLRKHKARHNPIFGDNPPWTFACFLTSVILWLALFLIEELLGCQGRQYCLEDWGRIPLKGAIWAVVIAAGVLLFKAWRMVVRRAQ